VYAPRENAICESSSPLFSSRGGGTESSNEYAAACTVVVVVDLAAVVGGRAVVDGAVDTPAVREPPPELHAVRSSTAPTAM
jgi:hypothetical protein